VIDPILGLPARARLVHPYQAVKHYRCPACGHGIAPRTGHYVVVPDEAPELRRHWHRGCWERELQTRGDG